jgi:hypothetical protein
MFKTRQFYFLIFLLFLISCGSPENSKSKKLSYSNYEIKTSKTAFDPFVSGFKCDSLHLFPQPIKGNIQKVIVFNGILPLDTLLFDKFRLLIGEEKEIIRADLNFDGFCEFIFPDRKSVKKGAIKHYYFIFDTDKHKFIENTSLPAYIGGFKLDIKNQRVKLYCPDQVCFAYYKYSIEKKFELVQGEFKSVD